MMTQSDSEGDIQEDETMSKDGLSDFTRKISPSAQAILRFIRLFEIGKEIDVFQDDADFQNLHHIVKVYKGSLHDDLTSRLQEVIMLGGVEIITQRDVMSLIKELWDDNVSFLTKAETPYLEAALKNPGNSLKDLSQKAGQTYSQSRRAQKRLIDTGVLKIGGMLNTDLLGLERVLIVLENPALVLTGPYTQKHLFVDGYSPFVFTVGMVPYSQKGNLLDTIKSLRNATTNASVYSLSTGQPSFNGVYSQPKKGWSLDLLHFRLLLRKGGDPITLADIPAPSISENAHFTYSDIRIMDALIESLDGGANDIAESTQLSLSTAFRKKSNLLSKRIILPRSHVNIPQLSDRVIVICSPEVGGNIQVGWRNLPLTYTSQIQNLEDRTDKKMLLLSALPTGSAQDLLDVLKEESSKADDLSAWKVAAGIRGSTKVSSLYDRRRNTWLFDTSQHFDAVTYSVMRKDASSNDIPIDLA
jgi:hypothetical protein